MCVRLARGRLRVEVLLFIYRVTAKGRETKWETATWETATCEDTTALLYRTHVSMRLLYVHRRSRK